jgi:CheY-like chemotaxis protein
VNERLSEHSIPLLLVDRDLDTVVKYGEHLSRASYVLDYATDGRAALAKAIAHPPAVVITETRVPGIDGCQLIKLLRGDRDTERVPIIVLTSDAQPAQLERARAAGADAVLVKPCLPDRLLTELYRVRDLSRELNLRSHHLGSIAGDNVARVDSAVPRAHRSAMSHRHDRRTTTRPSVNAPDQICPDCLKALTYSCSYLGGVNARHPEQWDEFTCSKGCGTFVYRHRTRKLRRA